MVVWNILNGEFTKQNLWLQNRFLTKIDVGLWYNKLKNLAGFARLKDCQRIDKEK